MAGTISVTDALKKNPKFFDNRPDDVNWTLTVIDEEGKKHVYVGVDWEAKSRFGCVRNVVVVDDSGMPAFDRPDYYEAPNVNMIVWGRERNGEIKVAIINESRPHADNPENPDSKKSLVFGQIPMGFIDKIFNKQDIQIYEDLLQGAIRETGEETGASAIINKTQPRYPYLFASPSFLRSTNRLYFLEVDLGIVQKRAKIYGEKIYNAEFITVPELLARIRIGVEDVSGQRVIHRYGNSLALFMIFFSYYPEYFKA